MLEQDIIIVVVLLISDQHLFHNLILPFFLRMLHTIHEIIFAKEWNHHNDEEDLNYHELMNEIIMDPRHKKNITKDNDKKKR